jgi:hypothetical protein
MIKPPDRTIDRATAINRGMDYLYRLANTTEGFEGYGSLLICCFALVGATSRDRRLTQTAKARAQKLARRWQRAHPVATLEAGPEVVLDFLLVSYALSRLGLTDAALREQIRFAAQRFSVQDLLLFDPVSEPPPDDLPFACECGLKNHRGRKFCKRCRKRLEIQSRYRVWMRALAATYVSGRCGIVFGAGYPEVLKWLPIMRPYPVGGDEDVDLLRDAVYAVTHIVYTLNDYGTYRLAPRWLPREFEFLKANVAGACERKDPELLGELLDSLKAFGLPASHPLIVRGTDFLLTEQNNDGSWGDPDEENIRTRCHTTWTAIDGLRNCAWRGKRLSPEVELILKRSRR